MFNLLLSVVQRGLLGRRAHVPRIYASGHGRQGLSRGLGRALAGGGGGNHAEEADRLILPDCLFSL